MQNFREYTVLVRTAEGQGGPRDHATQVGGAGSPLTPHVSFT